MINYNNLFFKTGNPIINKFDFLKGFGWLYDLLIDLLSESITINGTKQEQEQMEEKINELGKFILLEEESIKEKKTKSIKKKKKNRNQISAFQKRFIKNAIKLYDKRTDICK